MKIILSSMKRSRTLLLLALICTTGSVALAQAADNTTAATPTTTLTFTTFNLEYYGLGGNMNNAPSDEFRDVLLRDFIAKNLGKTDVMSFQEVVDMARVKAKLLPAGWECGTYDHENPKHQHVVLCHRPGLQFSREPSDNNDIIDDVARNDGRSRPALHLIVSDSSGKAITRVIGVHLKAFPTFAISRYAQAKKIGLYLQKVADTTLPVVILGDFNTYPSTVNGKTADDAVIIGSVLRKYQAGMSEVAAPFENSYRTKKLKSHFDRIYRSQGVKLIGQASNFAACDSTDLTAVDAYNKTISDHCPVTATLQFAR